MFYAARQCIQSRAFDAASTYVMNALISDISPMSRLRESQRRACLSKTLDWLTSASWIIDCWRFGTSAGLKDLCTWEVATKRCLPTAIRGSVCDFLSIDMVTCLKQMRLLQFMSEFT